MKLSHTTKKERGYNMTDLIEIIMLTILLLLSIPLAFVGMQAGHGVWYAFGLQILVICRMAYFLAR
jgi:hypothetical protein